MGFLLRLQGNLEEAEPYYREVLEGRRRVQGDEHPETLGSINNLGSLLNKLARYDEAAEVLLAGEAAARRVHIGGNAWVLGNYLAKLGEAQIMLVKYPEAEKTLLEAYRLLAAGLGDDHPRTIKTVNQLLTLYESWHAAEPGKDYDDKVVEWGKKRVKESDANWP
jgi:tetratricopeptide (TPR) repeat protein